MKILKKLSIMFILLAISTNSFSCSKSQNGIINNPDDDKEITDEISVLKFRSASKDDREMIQLAINYAATNKIKTVNIPDGEYMIEATNPKGILLRDNIHLKLSEKAILKALPSNDVRYNIVRIHDTGNVIISGGKIIGERNEHIGEDGEWGHGIDINNSVNVELKDISISDCWGDGIYIKGVSKDISLFNVICDNNRRQGMSVISVNGLVVKESTFKNTNGTPPQAGIDLEPNNASELVTNVLIENCKFIDNARYGFHTYTKRGPVTKVKVINCTMDNNPIGASLIHDGTNQIEFSSLKISNCALEGMRFHKGAKGAKVTKVEIKNSSEHAIRISEATNVQLSDVTVNGYNTYGVMIEKSSDIKISSSTFQTETTALGFDIKDSKAVELSTLGINGGNVGILCSNTETFELFESTLESQVENGLYLENVNSAKVHENNFNRIAQTPIIVNNSNNNKIYNNIFNSNCSLTDNTHSQIYIEGTSQNNEFNDNIIPKSTLSNKAKYAVWLTPKTKSNKVFNNTIDVESYNTSAIKDEGENNQTN